MSSGARVRNDDDPANPANRPPAPRLSVVKLLDLAIGILLAFPATAAELRDLCADRPGLDTPACTVDRGHLQLEVGVGDWTHDESAAEETDQVLVGDSQLRYGVTDAVEARLGWTPYGHVRSRDRFTGETDEASGVGDVTFGLKANLIHPEGTDLSVALLPFATGPTGQRPIGAGDWGAGLLVPISVPLVDRVEVALTPEVDAAVDADRDGRHLAAGGAAGVDLDLSQSVSIGAELAALRDEDPGNHTTQVVAGVSGAWHLREDWQLDLGSNLGLDRGSPDIEVYAGIAKRF
jgi:hypothetical protein